MLTFQVGKTVLFLWAVTTYSTTYPLPPAMYQLEWFQGEYNCHHKTSSGEHTFVSRSHLNSWCWGRHLLNPLWRNARWDSSPLPLYYRLGLLRERKAILFHHYNRNPPRQSRRVGTVIETDFDFLMTLHLCQIPWSRVQALLLTVRAMSGGPLLKLKEDRGDDIKIDEGTEISTSSILAFNEDFKYIGSYFSLSVDIIIRVRQIMGRS